MGVAGGVATLSDSGQIPASQLPSYVDDVLEYDNQSAFPETGETGKIYVAKDTNLTYRWTGSAYVEVSKSLALGETNSTAYAGDKGAANRAALESLPSTLVSSVSRGAIDGDNITININQTTKSGLNYATPSAANFDLPAATTSAAGLMSATDKTHINKLWGTALSSVTIYSATGTSNQSGIIVSPGVRNNVIGGGQADSSFGITIPLATTSANGVMSSADKTKLDGIGSISNQTIDEICV